MLANIALEIASNRRQSTWWKKYYKLERNAKDHTCYYQTPWEAALYSVQYIHVEFYGSDGTIKLHPFSVSLNVMYLIFHQPTEYGVDISPRYFEMLRLNAAGYLYAESAASHYTPNHPVRWPDKAMTRRDVNIMSSIVKGLTKQ